MRRIAMDRSGRAGQAAQAVRAVVCGGVAIASGWCAAQPATPGEPAAAASAAVAATPWAAWRALPTEAYRGKQDDIVFVSPDVGYYGNGAGKLFGTVDGGETWELRSEKPGTFIRCLAFLDENTGFIGNVGTGYFPNVSDETVLYRTDDGGRTLTPVTGLRAEGLKGLCALEVVRYPFINAGEAGEKTLIVGGGRVGGPAWLVMSRDLGETWEAMDLSPHGAMVLDVHFFTDQIGLVASASSGDVSESRAVILMTEDGGASWRRVYESTRPFELTWKMHFPSRSVGYCTVQSYNPDPSVSTRYVAKTEDGGRTWRELPLVDDAAVREFGVAFVSERVGWVGAVPGGFLTEDGGATWTRVSMGNAVNKIRVVPVAGEAGAVRVFAIGSQVHRLDAVVP